MTDNEDQRDKLEEALTSFFSDSTSETESAKLSSAHFDRLIVISGAALTVSLTAIGTHKSLYSTAISAWGVVAVALSWALFIFAIILAMLANWVSAYTAPRLQDRSMARLLFHRIRTFLKVSRKEALLTEPSTPLHDLKLLIDSPRLKTWKLIGFVMGVVSQVMVVVAFFFMLCFLLAMLRP